MTFEPISRELPHRFRTTCKDVKPYVKSPWRSLLRPKHERKDTSNISSASESDQLPWPRFEGLIDLSDSWTPSSFNNRKEASSFMGLSSTQAIPELPIVEEASFVDDSGVVLNRWLYANPSELPPPPVPDKIALDTETCRTLGPPRQSDHDLQTCSLDSGYCSFDSNHSASGRTSLGLKKRFCYEPEDLIHNLEDRCDDITATRNNPNFSKPEISARSGRRSSRSDVSPSHGAAPQSPSSDLLVSPYSSRSRATSTIQSVIGSQSGSSLTGSTSVYDVDDDLVRAKLNHQLLQRLMEEFYSLLDSILLTTAHNQPTNSSGRASEASTTSSSTSSSFLSQNSSLGKGKARGNGPEPPGDDQEKNNRRKRSRNGELLGKLYACPFYKYDPQKYGCGTETRSKFRSCTGPGFSSIARLKQHLRRAHTPPPQCHRCWEVFSDESSLELHARSLTPCQVLDKEVIEGISNIKFELLSRHGVHWKEIYQIIFPGAPLPASYYHDSLDSPASLSTQHQSMPSLELASYEAYARTELPRLVEAMLEGMIKAETEPLEERFKPLLVDVVRSCHSTLTHRWQSLIATTSPSPPMLQSLEESLIPSLDSHINYQDSGHQNQMYIPSVVTSAYQEPPFWDSDLSMTAFEAFSATQIQPLSSIAEHNVSDSGYATQSQTSNSEYFCRCHQSVDYSAAVDSNVYNATNSSAQGLDNSKFGFFPSFRPSLGDLQAKRVIRCNGCGGWQFT